MTSTIKVNTITTESGSTLTIGGCGKTVALASGASQTGFGREGSVDWQTSSIKTSTFTAVSGEGYFVDTSSGGVTANLPAGTAGAIVAFADYTRSFNSNNLNVSPNGSNKIGGVAANAVLDVDGQAATFVYVDSTEGWINVQETQTSQAGRAFITATGGTITTSGNFKIHTFTGPGTFCVSQISSSSPENTVGYMVVAGGGASAGGETAGGGGAGGYREGRNATVDNFTASPLVANAPTNAVTLTATAFPITVGAGGAAPSPGFNVGNNGSQSVFSTITSAGGGGGGPGCAPSKVGIAGGSGGGGSGFSGAGAAGGAGNTPPVSPPQGNPGGTGSAKPGNTQGSGAGGGAGGADSNAGPVPDPGGGPGGNGVASSITGSPVTRAGGGGGGLFGPGPFGSGGPGGGGTGGRASPNSDGAAGTANTGGGGGSEGGPGTAAGNGGGSGIVIIRYKFQ